MRRAALILLMGMLFALSTLAGARAEGRVALVIGNDDYAYAPKLRNAVADARAFKSELEQRGFQVVFAANADRHAMNDAVEDFLGKLSSDSIGVIYFSGHGVQIDSANFLIPTDLKAAKAADVANDGIDLGRLIDRVSQTRAKFTLAVIDACRDNPFKVVGRGLGTRGLAPLASNAAGLMVVYSAGANQEALDRLGADDHDPNGLFTREFIRALRIPGLRVQESVDAAKRAVIEKAKAVGHVQTPAIYDQSTGTFIFTPGTAPTAEPGPAASAVAAARPAPTLIAPDPRKIDDDFWSSVDVRDPAQIRAYLDKFPAGEFASLARGKLAALEAAASAPPPARSNAPNGPVPTAPPAAAPPTANVAFVRYRGVYICGQGRTAFTLNVSRAVQNGERQVLVFAGPTRETPNIPHMSWLYAGRFDLEGGVTQLRPVRWLIRPPGYQLIAMSGVVSAGGGRIEGRVLDPACGAFQGERED